MTPDDKRRLAGFYMIRMTPGSEIEPAQWSQVMGCWLTCGSEERISDRLVHEVVCNLDQALAERDAAVAALRDLVRQIEINDFRDSLGHAAFRLHAYAEAQRLLAAHSAATKPTEEISG